MGVTQHTYCYTYSHGLIAKLLYFFSSLPAIVSSLSLYIMEEQSNGKKNAMKSNEGERWTAHLRDCSSQDFFILYRVGGKSWGVRVEEGNE